MLPDSLSKADADHGTPEALDVRGVAKLLGCSERHVWALTERGNLPKPLALGRLRRWFRPAVVAALAKLHAKAQAVEVEP